MSYPPTLPRDKTVLQRIVDEVITRITAMVDEDGNRLWNNITTGSNQFLNAMTVPALSVYQGPEESIHDLWPHTEKIVTFYVEFRYTFYENIDSEETFRYYLGKLQARLFGTRDNITIGGLAINVLEHSSNPEIEGKTDPAPGGMLIFNAHYRHWTADPYHLPSETPNYVYGSL